MQDDLSDFSTSLADLSKGDWYKKVSEIAETHGYAQTLGDRHFVAFLEKKPVLLVSFETVQSIQSLSEANHPMGWELFKDHGWSHLCIVSDGNTWFRDPQVYAYFDRLVDDGFFDEFEQVIFYGSQSCGYAAAAFSVAAPGATVLAIQPQATLDPRVTEWDDRYKKLRRTDFTQRYGYAPDMLDAAEQAYVVYDPSENLDAAHAAMFTRPNVKKLRIPNMGPSLQSELVRMEILLPLILMAADDNLTTLRFAKTMRARRENRAYLYRLLQKLDRAGRDPLTRMLCENVTGRYKAPRFASKLAKLNAEPSKG